MKEKISEIKVEYKTFDFYTQKVQDLKDAQDLSINSVFAEEDMQLTDKLLAENGWTENNLEKDLEILNSLKKEGYNVDEKKSELEERIKVQDEKGNKATEFLKTNHEVAYNEVLANQTKQADTKQVLASEDLYWKEKASQLKDGTAPKFDIDDESKTDSKGKEKSGKVKKSAIFSTMLTPFPLARTTVAVGSKIADTLDEKYNISEKAADFIEKGKSHVEIANGLMKDTKGAKDFLTKQNYAAGTIMSDGFSLEILEDINKSYPEIRASKEAGVQYIKSDLSEEEQKEARKYALDLISTRVMDNIANIPDYGDCRTYYNEASLMDWVATHPVNMTAREVSENYDEWSKKTVGKDGMFTLFNVPTYIENGVKKDKQADSKIRQDNVTDMFANVQTIDDIKGSIVHKMDIVEEMNKNIDNPQKFAELYYEVTDGMNFFADKVVKYQQNAQNDKDRVPLDAVIGRNYTKEDIKKNEMLTNMFFEVNKSVGTMLASSVITPVGAGAVNVAVTALEEKTQNNADDINWLEICLVEGVARPVACGGVAEKVAGKVAPKIVSEASTGTKTLVTKGVGTIIADDTYSIASGISNVASGDYGAATGDAVGMLLHIKSGVKTAFKSAGAIGHK